MSRPFRVNRSISVPGYWHLWMQAQGSAPRRLVGYFENPGEAIDFAYKHWPWWP